MGMVYFRKGKLMNGIMKFPFMSLVQGKRNTCIQYTRKKVTHLNLINHPALKMSCDICPAKQHWQQPLERLSNYRAFFLK
jgi:hypothetical protein